MEADSILPEAQDISSTTYEGGSADTDRGADGEVAPRFYNDFDEDRDIPIEERVQCDRCGQWVPKACGIHSCRGLAQIAPKTLEPEPPEDPCEAGKIERLFDPDIRRMDGPYTSNVRLLFRVKPDGTHVIRMEGRETVEAMRATCERALATEDLHALELHLDMLKGPRAQPKEPEGPIVQDGDQKDVGETL